MKIIVYTLSYPNNNSPIINQYAVTASQKIHSSQNYHLHTTTTLNHLGFENWHMDHLQVLHP